MGFDVNEKRGQARTVRRELRGCFPVVSMQSHLVASN